MAYIYKITNKINNKVYIGKTVSSIEERWKRHCYDSKKISEEKRPLYSAMKKYGENNFSIEQIEECSDDIVNEREIYWIEYYGSFKYGYNATLGGDGKHYADYDLIFALLNEGYTNKQICEKLNYNTHTVTIALKNKGVCEQERKLRGYDAINKTVAMLDKNNFEILQVFPSITEAYQFLGKQHSGHIASVCKGIRQTAYGYKWKYI